ncbi:Uu.00g095010.m01.CDS01 [Anthostomella pinea]|uniref:Uu.00g095010.m01.CDS01 n=1 Tax=Anthostomella pinea TaxID=933095 RepID=A0AAI8VNS6_9PEZI|nr:Uu.00g095010.m01.CDS01 [Anthostomella pinea]
MQCQKGTEEDPVVVVGFSFRFPQDAVSDDAFWKIICEGTSTMTEVPETRYNINGHHDFNPARQDMLPCRGGHYVKGDIFAFDAPFFTTSSTEARAMDPQLRVLLETSYHALESAGLPLVAVRGSSTSVFVGNLIAEYSSLYGNDDEINAKYQATGISSSMLSNRLSWFYDFRGPSISLDTACSSSLVGLHLACQSLRNGESEMSLVCGAQLQLDPRSMSIPMSRLNFLSSSSHCHSFDEQADGYSRGEGVGVVVLKRLSRALANGDTIRAVIRGTSANQDGRTPSISQPSSIAQAALIRKAYESVDSDFQSTAYFEAHSTGTPVGDPIEAQGISLAFSDHRDIHNPLFFPMTATDWPKEGLRRASANSFGFGGTNAHVVLDDALHYLQARRLPGTHNTVMGGSNTGTPGRGVGQPGKHVILRECPFLFVFSTADENGIQRLSTDFENHLHQTATDAETHYLADIAFTLSSKRTQHPWRSYALGTSVQDLRASLSNIA